MICLAAGLAVVLLAGAAAGGWELGRAATARQPDPRLVSAAFVRFQRAPGWAVVNRTRTAVALRDGASGSIAVSLGDARQDGVQSDADVFAAALQAITQDHLQGSVGYCLPVTRVRVGGRAGEEVGFLFHQTADGGLSVHEDCELAWADVQGTSYESWTAIDTLDELPALTRAVRSMQRSTVWK